MILLIHMKKYIIFFGLVLAAIMVGSTPAQAKCDFARDLEVGAVGEDVRCLQQFLNTEGFKIAESGVGSPGQETNLFREGTQSALKRWQSSKGLSSTGYFGPLSRAAYDVSVSAPAPIVIPDPIVVPAPTTAPEPSTAAIERKARSLVKSVRKVVEDVRDDVEQAEDDGEDVAGLEKILDKAEEKLIDALYAFIDQDYQEALTLLDRAADYAEDAREDVGGNKDDAKEAINDADDAIDEAKEEIDDADDDGDDVDEAEDLLDDADDKLDDAKEAYDDGDYDDAEELAQEAEDLAQEAIDAIGN